MLRACATCSLSHSSNRKLNQSLLKCSNRLILLLGWFVIVCGGFNVRQQNKFQFWTIWANSQFQEISTSQNCCPWLWDHMIFGVCDQFVFFTSNNNICTHLSYLKHWIHFILLKISTQENAKIWVEQMLSMRSICDESIVLLAIEWKKLDTSASVKHFGKWSYAHFWIRISVRLSKCVWRHLLDDLFIVQCTCPADHAQPIVHSFCPYSLPFILLLVLLLFWSLLLNDVEYLFWFAQIFALPFIAIATAAITTKTREDPET